MLAPNTRYWLSVVLSAAVLLVGLYACAATPLRQAWPMWVEAGLLSLVLAAMLLRWGQFLKYARWTCYAGLATSTVYIVLGVAGFRLYSMELAMQVVTGLVKVFVWALYLAGVQEACRRTECSTASP